MNTPTSVEELWDQGWVAETEDEAIAQAQRMFDLFVGKKVQVDRLTFSPDTEYEEEMFQKPWPEVWVDNLTTEAGWDGDALYAEWYVHAANPDQMVTTIEGKQYRMGDLSDLTTTPPGVGTAEGFQHKDRLVYPES